MNTKPGQKRERLALSTAGTCEKKLYNEQYIRYNLSGGHHCEQAVSGKAVRTALVYYCIHSSLYTGTVHSAQGVKYCHHAGSGHEPGAQAASTNYNIKSEEVLKI